MKASCRELHRGVRWSAVKKSTGPNVRATGGDWGHPSSLRGFVRTTAISRIVSTIPAPCSSSIPLRTLLAPVLSFPLLAPLFLRFSPLPPLSPLASTRLVGPLSYCFFPTPCPGIPPPLPLRLLVPPLAIPFARLTYIPLIPTTFAYRECSSMSSASHSRPLAASSAVALAACVVPAASVPFHANRRLTQRQRHEKEAAQRSDIRQDMEQGKHGCRSARIGRACEASAR